MSYVSSVATDYFFKMSEDVIGKEVRNVLFIIAGESSKTYLDFECDEAIGECAFTMPSIEGRSNAEVKLISEVPISL